jgi:hypothetical protein
MLSRSSQKVTACVIVFRFRQPGPGGISLLAGVTYEYIVTRGSRTEPLQGFTPSFLLREFSAPLTHPRWPISYT